MLALLLPLIKDVVLPELVDWLHDRHQQGLPPPTLEEVRARMDARADQIIANGEAFLALPTPPPDAEPVP